MSFARAFLSTLPWRPRDAFAALYWRMTGRRVRARNRLRIAAEQTPRAYHTWLRTIEVPARAALPTPASPPFFTVFLHNTGAESARTVASLEALDWPAWELVVVHGRNAAPLPTVQAPRVVLSPIRTDDGVTALDAGMAAACGAWIVPVSAGTQLPSTALAGWAAAIATRPEATAFYGDHDQIDLRGLRSRPWFKPQWNRDLALSQDYVSPACTIAASAIRGAMPLPPHSDGAAVYALLMKLAEQGMPPVHVPLIQAHLRDAAATTPRPARMAVLAHLLDGTGTALREGIADTVSIAWPLPEEKPLVSIIVPTRDNLALIRECIHGVLTCTRYRPIEVLIVDNGSVRPEMLAYLDRVATNPAVRVLRDDGPFNFSAINNRAVRQARGDFICLLNDDTEIIDAQWLTELMRHAVRPDVGAVGAKLLYDDGSIQHAGVTVGMGDAAGHAHRFQRPGSAGYFHRVDVTHAPSAVTAACLVVSREKFEAVGGLDEDAFAVAFNDVDLCLKLQAAGWHNLYEPRATLVHHESKSRGKDHAPSQIERFHRELATLRQRWQTVGYIDPLFHPMLDHEQESYILRLHGT